MVVVLLIEGHADLALCYFTNNGYYIDMKEQVFSIVYTYITIYIYIRIVYKYIYIVILEEQSVTK